MAAKSSAFTSSDEAINLLRGLDQLEFSKYRVIGGILRYTQSARNSMKDFKQRIVSSLTSQPFGCDNYLIWAPPGSGKSFFVQEIAKSLGSSICYRELNLAQLDERDFRSALTEIEKLDKPRLCFIDEVDSKPTESWPYEALLPSLEPPANRKTIRTCFVFAGSSGDYLYGMKENIAKRPKGMDLMSRIPPGNEFVIEGLGLGDRLLVVSTQFLNAAEEHDRHIDEVEKMVLYYVASDPRLKSARQIRQLAVRCLERMPLGEERIKFDYLFDAGDPDNKEFWNKAGSLRNELVNAFVRLEDDQDQHKTPTGLKLVPRLDKRSVAKELTFGKNRIAVLPFPNISPDPKDEYFADGMTEELISTLSRIRELKVISRTSVMRYKQTEKSLSEIASELNVNAILEGSVRKMGDDLRITAQLIDVQNDEHLWSEDYDRKFENVFSLQKEIAQKVADSLQVNILSKEGRELGKKPTQNMEAYTLYLKGRNYSYRWTLESFKKVISYCEQAIQKDPNYAQAYASIATAYSAMGTLGMLPSNEAFLKAESFAEKAMQLDPSIPESHLALGVVLYFHKWDFRGAEIEYRRAVELNPNSVDGHLDLAQLLALVRRFDEAFLECRRALELDPLSALTSTRAGFYLLHLRRVDEAIELLRNAIELEQSSALAHVELGIAYARKGMIEEGISEIKIGIEISNGKIANMKSDLADAYARAGKIDEARDVLSDLLKMWEEGHMSETAIAAVYLSLGEKDIALQWLEKAFERHAGFLVWINIDTNFEDFRSDPRFKAFLKKIGFPDSE